ncbi:putative uncharacterized protein MGC34800 [Orycteropus afer afer]|uniref:Uncharacterized protein n=1 Tax=Orycteropus afer afer TaxID=1230840 RepID=A0A8B7AZB3_ORYAF|nr:putative uncharacterized protein MGC34800 [Orycteropus afer afer]
MGRILEWKYSAGAVRPFSGRTEPDDRWARRARRGGFYNGQWRPAGGVSGAGPGEPSQPRLRNPGTALGPAPGSGSASGAQTPPRHCPSLGSASEAQAPPQAPAPPPKALPAAEDPEVRGCVLRGPPGTPLSHRTASAVGSAPERVPALYVDAWPWASPPASPGPCFRPAPRARRLSPAPPR